jgi:hypothetical protein
MLDRFVPVWDAGHHYAARVEAPAEIAMGTALAQDYMAPRLVRALVWLRALMLGSRPVPPPPSRGLLADMRAIGWGVLAEYPDVVVMGAVTRPWEPRPAFRPVAPAAFADFHEPGLVKIAWALRVEPDGPRRSTVHIETRAVATDAAARRRFRTYWALISRGTALIRRALLVSIRRAAEHPMLVEP